MAHLKTELDSITRSKKYPNTKIAISQKCARIFVLNFARFV